MTPPQPPHFRTRLARDSSLRKACPYKSHPSVGETIGMGGAHIFAAMSATALLDCSASTHRLVGERRIRKWRDWEDIGNQRQPLCKHSAQPTRGSLLRTSLSQKLLNTVVSTEWVGFGYCISSLPPACPISHRTILASDQRVATGTSPKSSTAVGTFRTASTSHPFKPTSERFSTRPPAPAAAPPAASRDERQSA